MVGGPVLDQNPVEAGVALALRMIDHFENRLGRVEVAADRSVYERLEDQFAISRDLGSSPLSILDRRVEHGLNELGEREPLGLGTPSRVAGDAGAKRPLRGGLP
jgi:hypothetical protein